MKAIEFLQCPRIVVTMLLTGVEMKVVILAGGLGMHLSEENSKVFFEQEPMKGLTGEGQLSAHFLSWLWQCYVYAA